MIQDTLSFSGDAVIDPNDFLCDVVIPRPPTLAAKCPVESQSKHFPAIDDASKKPRKQPPFASDSLEFWLKPGISLPKLHTKDAGLERIETSESLSSSDSQSLPPIQISESSTSESRDLVKCSEIKSDITEVPESVVGPSKCELLFRVPSSEFDLSKCKIKDEPLEESHALENWRRWNEEHKKQAAYLCEKLKKKPQELMIRQSETFRKNLENKIMLGMWDYPEADRYMAQYSKWSLPMEGGRRRRKNSRTRLAGSYLENSLTQKRIARDLEFIFTPNVIKKEKELRSTQSVNHLFIKPNLRISDAAATAEERIRSFLKSRNRLRPPSEIINALAVVGTQILPPVEKKPEEPPVVSNLPAIEITPPDQSVSDKDFRKSVFCLVINGIEITYEVDQDTPGNPKATNFDYIWEFAFGLNEIGQRLKKVLKIENRGTIAVRYDWVAKRLDSSKYLNKLKPKGHEPCFFFDKNSGIFLPGQFYNFEIYFHAKTSGPRTETWYLKTIPSFGKNVEFVTIVLSGVASNKSTNLKSEILETYFTGRLRDSITKFILNVLLQRVLNNVEGLKELEYQSMFCEKQLFEYHNPSYYYHSDLVDELNIIFQTIRTKEQNIWDCSLDSLTKLICTSPKVENRGSMLCNVSEIAKKLLKPRYVFEREDKKYRLAYNILCKMVNFMEEDHNYLRKILSTKKHGYRTNWEYGEYGEHDDMFSGMTSSSGDKDELDSGTMFEMKPVNFIYFQTMFYIKVYHRVREALENIADMLETRKRFETKETDYKRSKPSRPGPEPSTPTNGNFPFNIKHL